MILGQIVSIEVRNFKYEVSASEFLIVLTTLLFLFYRIIKKDLAFYVPAVVVFFSLYLFLITLSVFWANDISRTIIALRVGLYHGVIFLLTLNLIKNKKDLRYLFYSFSFAALIISAQLAYQVYQLGGFFTKFIPNRTSIVTPVGPWVTVSAIIVLLLPIMYGVGLSYFRKNKFWFGIFLGGTVFAALASMLTLGKTEFVAMAVGMGFMNYKYFKKDENMARADERLEESGHEDKKNPGPKRSRLVITAVITLAGAVVLLSPFGQGFMDRFARTLNDENTKFRIHEYQLTFRAVQDNFFTGVGAGNLKVYFRNNGLCQCYTEANNYILHFLGELGIVGLLLFIGGGHNIASSIKTLNIAMEREKIIVLSLKAAVIIFLITGFFEVTLAGLNYGIVFWMMVGALLAFEKIIKIDYSPA